MNLIIVESPTKAKTIAKFLDSTYKVESSFGHIRDLPKSKIGVDVENNFTPSYVIPTTARKNVTALKKLVEKSDQIILASDEDREGEAIAWHLAEALEVPENKIKRIAFHEITKPAIMEALENPREIDLKMVDAQQTRRILDRLVGYELSPFLWKKVAKGLSAGRVQSVATRLIVEREREIQAFKPEEYWSIEADFKAESKEEFKSKLNKIDGKAIGKLEIKDEKNAKSIVADLEKLNYSIASVEKKETQKNAPKPFTTSSLQQTANRMLGFSAKQTMMVAQKLYEMGLITYMRTDSVNLSSKFIDEANQYIITKLGKEFAETRRFKTKSKNAQEAHEAVRPTEVSKEPGSMAKLDNNQNRLYTLIWQRSVASQMANALVDATSIDIESNDKKYQFRSTGQVIKFKGYLEIYPEKSQELILPELKEAEVVELLKLEDTQHFTKPPARYSDAGLVKVMERYGIGRPSTYAPTIATIIARNYVERDENKKLAPTEISFIVIDLLKKHFADIVDYDFTAAMENNLDEIATGQREWQPVLKEFYEPFHSNLEKKYDEVQKEDLGTEQASDEICDKCNAPMIIKQGRYGKFYACSAFPECRNIKSIDKEQGGSKSKSTAELEEKYKGETCAKCGSEMTVKTGRFGPFLACSGYPKCKNIKNIKENNNSTGIKCPKCGQGEIVKKMSRRGVFYACDNYPDCKNAYWQKPLDEKCPDCEALLIEEKDGQKVCSAKCGFKG